MSEIDSGIRFKQSGNIINIAGDDVPASCDINAKVGGNIIGVKTVATDNGLASDARVRIGGETKALKLQGTSYVPVNVYGTWENDYIYKYGSGKTATEDDAWNSALANFNAFSWRVAGEIWTTGFSNSMRFREDRNRYDAFIIAGKIKLTVDLTAYDPADYELASLVVVPDKFRYDEQYFIPLYYNEQGLIEGDYNFLKDMIGELGTEWVSADYYPTGTFTPLRPAVGYEYGYRFQNYNLVYQGIYVMLIPKT